MLLFAGRGWLFLFGISEHAFSSYIYIVNQFYGQRERKGREVIYSGSLGLDPHKETFGTKCHGYSISGAIARDRVVWAVRSWIIQYGQDLT